MDIIDSHTHIGSFGEWNFSVQALIGLMDGHGVRFAIVSDVTTNEFDYAGNRISTGAGQIELNEAALHGIGAYADRFRLLFWIRPYSEQDDEELASYLEANRDHYVGLKVHPKCAGVRFGDPRYESYLSVCERLRLPCCVHTEKDGFSDVRYVYEAATRHPGVDFVAVHAELGSDHAEAFDYASRCANLFIDTTLMATNDVLRAIDICGSEKIMFGSDASLFGGQSYDRYAGLHDEIVRRFGTAAVEKVFSGNAERVFGL